MLLACSAMSPLVSNSLAQCGDLDNTLKNVQHTDVHILSQDKCADFILGQNMPKTITCRFKEIYLGTEYARDCFGTITCRFILGQIMHVIDTDCPKTITCIFCLKIKSETITRRIVLLHLYCLNKISY
jgi:hypothetical protein